MGYINAKSVWVVRLIDYQYIYIRSILKRRWIMKKNIHGDLLALRLSVSGLETYLNATVLDGCDEKKKEVIQGWIREIKQVVSGIINSEN